MMADKYSVAISYRNALGYIEYDAAAKTAEVVLGDDEGKQMVEDYLRQTHDIKIPHETLMDFTTEKIEPLASQENLQIALTRLWNTIGVHVDWSRPVDYVKLHPHY